MNGQEVLPNEMFLLDGLDFIILESDIEPYKSTVGMHYAFESRVAIPANIGDNVDHVIRRIVSHNDKIRPVSQTRPLCSELEIIYFGRRYLLDTFTGILDVISVALINFNDGFRLYRNRYHSLIGMYLMLAGLSLQERLVLMLVTSLM